jgi:hypothetical protein
MQRKVMIACAVTGSADTPSRNPAVPVTPEQIAASAIDAAKAGAAIVHIHVRDPKTTKPSMDPALYREVVERIRSSGTDVLINLTTGPGARFIPGDEEPLKPAAGSTLTLPATRVRHVVELKPDAPIGLDAPGDPIQRVPGAGKRIHDDRTTHAGRRPDSCRDVPSDQIGKAVTRALDRRPPQQPHALRKPVRGLEPVDRDEVRIPERIATVALHFGQVEHLVALLAEQQPTVICTR